LAAKAVNYQLSCLHVPTKSNAHQTWRSLRNFRTFNRLRANDLGGVIRNLILDFESNLLLGFCDCGPAEGGHAAMGLSALVRYDQAHGEMHSTSTRASLSGCGGGVPRVRWPWRLPRLQQLLPVLLVSVVSVLLVSVPLLGGEWRQRSWLVRRQHTGALVARRFVRGVYAC
jgi:hypothetical protein